MRTLLPAVHRAVTESWPDLLPGSADWSGAARKRARASVKAALEGIEQLVVQGDLDDRTWERTRTLVHGSGHAGREEVAELLRSVRVVGVEVLADGLEDSAGLTHAERWDLQREISAYCDELLGEDEELEQGAYSETLAELERSGPDIR